MSKRPPFAVLPAKLHAALDLLGDRLMDGPMPDERAVHAILADLALLPAKTIVKASSEITAAARLGYWRPPKPFRLSDLFKRPAPPPTARQVMANIPAIAWLFLFHGDGRIRQAALERLSEPPTSSFFFAAIAWRLNDWAEPVRAAAVGCATRLFPATSPEFAAQAGLVLLDRGQHWARWTNEKAALDAVLARPDVAAQLTGLFLHGANGPFAMRLRDALRHPIYDSALPTLSRDAVQPAVRATALKVLLAHRAAWPVGHEWKWIDKTYGVRQRQVVLASRSVDHAEPLDRLIAQGLADRSPVVRRIAADGVIEHRGVLSDIETLIATLAQDRNSSVRERADYLIRHP